MVMAPPAQRTIDRYTHQGLVLLPPGRALTRERGTVIHRVMEACGLVFARVHEDAAALRREFVPSQAVELLPAWERVTGLPNCLDAAPTDIPGRQAALVSHLASAGGQSEQDLVALAASVGFDVEVEHEHMPMTCVDPCTSPVADIGWVYHLVITVLDGPPELLGLLACRLDHHLHLYAHVRLEVDDVPVTALLIDGEPLLIGDEYVVI